MPDSSTSQGTAAWGFRAPGTRATCHGVVRTSGRPLEVNAYRSELQGFHSMLLALHQICRFYKLTEGHITLACDNDTCMRLAADQRPRVPCRQGHADLIRAIRHLLAEIPIQVTLSNVKGHKDSTHAWEELSPLEQLNCTMDKSAKAFLRQLLQQESQDPALPPAPSIIYGEGITCHVCNDKVTGRPKELLHEALYAQQMKAKLHKDGSLDASLFDTVDWRSIGAATQYRSKAFRTWMTKHVSGECGVGRKMKLWGFKDTDACPCCGTPDETTHHVVHCQDERMQAAYTEAVEDFISWMQIADTHPTIEAYFTQLLSPDQDGPLVFTEPHEQAHQALVQQTALGQSNTLLGRLSTLWHPIQAKHYQATNARCSADSWIKDMIWRLLKISQTMWITRNNILHEKDKQGLLLEEGRTLQEEIEIQYRQGKATLLATDQGLIDNYSLEGLTKSDPSDKYTWLGAIKLARRLWEEDASSALGQQRTNFRAFFGLGPQPGTTLAATTNPAAAAQGPVQAPALDPAPDAL